MVDIARKEVYSGKDEPRRFMVQVWYPAEIKPADKRAPWMANAAVYMRAIATYIELPSFFLDHLGLVKTPAYLDAAFTIADHTFPVILFSHGWNGFSTQNSSQAIELASRGYVVISIQHTYGAVTTVFSDGTIAPNNPNTLPIDADDPDYEIVARKLVNQWAGDMSFVLDQFQGLNGETNSIFFHKLDLERVGVYGHSTGGGAAIQFCGTDTRCKAVLAMDPFMRPVSAEVIENGVSQPSFFLFSQLWAEDPNSKNNILFNQFHANATGTQGVIEITGTKHFDFSDVPLLSPIAPQLGLRGLLNGQRVIMIVNSYLLDFFEMTMRKKPSQLFGGAFSDFSEVKVLKQ
jgi:dienelactone hydrolase